MGLSLSKIILQQWFIINISMNIVNQLLSGIGQSQQKQYQTYLHTHLKWMMTGINKARVQDTSKIQIKKNKCIEQCYSKNLESVMEIKQANKLNNQALQNIYDIVQEIRQCKQRCGRQKEAVKKYLDDINYYSSLKFASCSQDCKGDQHSSQYNSCIWNCLNKLDRRYKKYWIQQREKVQRKFQVQN